ncbi:MAG: hypothetical protein EXR72_09770 [Myxococcales bacterium]|nr:hypothetical protein [Myxococcales bacterium]
MSARDLLGRIVALLDRAGIPYMLVGSFASTFHGVPRTTHDIDLVIAPTTASLRALLDLFPEDEYYVSEEAAEDALRRRSMFNVIDLATGWKADLIVRKERPFSREEFARRAPARLLDLEVFIASAEDTILAKLEWAKAGESDLQLRDASGVVDVQGEALDRAYVERWAAELGIADLWRDLPKQR